MPYLISGLVVAAGVVVLLALLIRLAGPARQLAGTAQASRAHWARAAGLLAARIATLRVQLLARRGRPHESSSGSTPAA